MRWFRSAPEVGQLGNIGRFKKIRFYTIANSLFCPEQKQSLRRRPIQTETSDSLTDSLLAFSILQARLVWLRERISTHNPKVGGSDPAPATKTFLSVSVEANIVLSRAWALPVRCTSTLRGSIVGGGIANPAVGSIMALMPFWSCRIGTAI